MSTDFYRELCGLRSDEALQQSLSAIKEGLEDVEAGRIHDMDTVFRELDERYDIQHSSRLLYQVQADEHVWAHVSFIFSSATG